MAPFLMNLAACFIVILINKGLKQHGGDLAIGALTMYDARLRLSNQVAAEVKKHFEDMVFETIIQRNTKLAEAPRVFPGTFSRKSGYARRSAD